MFLSSRSTKNCSVHICALFFIFFSLYVFLLCTFVYYIWKWREIQLYVILIHASYYVFFFFLLTLVHCCVYVSVRETKTGRQYSYFQEEEKSYFKHKTKRENGRKTRTCALSFLFDGPKINYIFIHWGLKIYHHRIIYSSLRLVVLDDIEEKEEEEEEERQLSGSTASPKHLLVAPHSYFQPHTSNFRHGSGRHLCNNAWLSMLVKTEAGHTLSVVSCVCVCIC